MFGPYELEIAFTREFFILYSPPRILRLDHTKKRPSPLIEFVLSPVNCHFRKKVFCFPQGSVIAFSGQEILDLNPVFSFSADLIHPLSLKDFVVHLEQLEWLSGADLLDQPNDFIAVVREEVPLSFARRLVQFDHDE